VDYMRQLWNDLTQIWRRLSTSARINIGLSVAGTLTLIAILVISGSRSQYVRLYSGLDADDSSSIQAYFRENDLPYKVRNEGAEIDVRIQDRSDLRVKLRALELPKSHGAGMGFEIFDQQNLMTSKSLQDIQYRRAVQGKLQRMLNEFDFVNSCSVYISEEKDSLFATEQKPSEAAVTLNMSRGLSKAEKKAVLGVISTFGGANLSPDNITLATTDGQALHLPTNDDTMGIANTKLEYIQEFERARQIRAESALEEIGVKSVVRVSLDIDWATKEETKNLAEDGAVLSSMVVNAELTSTESLPEGPRGATENLPGGGPPGGVQTEETTKETIENFEPSLTMTKTSTPPGGVSKAYVSAFVEGVYAPAMDDEGKPTGEKEYNPRSDDELKSYQSIIARAVGGGITPEEVEVFDHPFTLEVAGVPGTLDGFRSSGMMGMVTTSLVMGFKILIVLGCFLRNPRKKRKRSLSLGHPARMCASAKSLLKWNACRLSSPRRWLPCCAHG
jgi:flagellar M-ring protein FliF